jgi:hypothetical protein
MPLQELKGTSATNSVEAALAATMPNDNPPQTAMHNIARMDRSL